MKNKSATIYIDGSSHGNPGPAGVGIVIHENSRVVKSIYKYIGEATNNVAEYTALIYSLQEALILGIKELVIKSDSELMVNQLKGTYKVRNLNLRTFYDQFIHLKDGFEKVEVGFISRENNVEADKLANKAIDSRAGAGLKKV